MQIALVSRPGDVLEAYVRFFEANGVHPLHCTSVSELYHKLPDTSLSGVVVDMPTLVKSVGTEKFLLQTLEGVFPNIRTNWNPKAGFQAIFHDSSKSGEENLRAFLQDCRNFKPRGLRKDKRTAKNFNVLFWLDGESEQTAQRAYTSDICGGGLFVCTCYPPPVDTSVWVKLLDLDERPFKLVVRWKMDWGVAKRVPGFGGMFVDLQDDLAKKVADVLI
jgi:hypothetical protein